MTRTLALLDKPNRSSFGLTPLAVEERGGVRVLGLAPASVHRGRGLDDRQVQELISGGHALATEISIPQDELSSDTVALWLGEAFAERAEKLNLPTAPLPTVSHRADGGRFFLGPAESMYPYLEYWTNAAFRRFRAESDSSVRRNIAALMDWVLPNRAESLAAKWISAPDPDRELLMQIRTFARDRDPEALRVDHEKLLSSSDALADLRLVVFTGGTGVKRGDLAQRFAKQFALDVTTFRKPIANRVDPQAINLGEKEVKQLLMDRGQAAVDTSPLGLALEALRSTSYFRKVLVVDGLRHHAIRDTLRWLQPRKLVIVGVTVDSILRRQRVIARGEDPDLLFGHKTEREIPQLTVEADRQIAETAPESELRELFDALQA